MSKNVAIVVGHHKFSKGAKSQWLPSEWDLMSEVAKSLCDVADIFYHDPKIGGYTSRQRAMAKRTRLHKYVFELHYNAASPIANGCEALYYFSNKGGYKIATKFCELVSESMEIKNRKAKPMLNSTQRGYAFVYQTNGTAIILEPFFGTSGSDVAKFDKAKYVQVLRTLIKGL